MLLELPTIADAARRMIQGTMRPLDLVEHCLGRIAQMENQVHAWVMVDADGARREARRLGEMLDRGEQPLSPLHGIPIGIKDIIDVAGWPTKCGSKLREGHLAEQDAQVVTRLRKAGAIILGKTVTTEFASFDPPPTRNPWNLNHTPGGSSSGSAAAVALEMCMAALGTQTGGSIVRPASYCGVVGFKPRLNPPSLRGIFPFSMHLDHLGPIARNVADAKEVWKQIGVAAEDSAPGTLQSHDDQPAKLLMLQGGVLEAADAQTRQQLDRVASQLSEKFEVGSLAFPGYMEDAPVHHRRIMAVEGVEIHRQAFEKSPGLFGPKIRSLFDEGVATSVLDYALALRRQSEITTAVWHDALWKSSTQRVVWLMPATPTPAPGSDTTGNPLFNSLWSFVGMPTITIPCGVSTEGLPFGLQLIHPLEQVLLSVALQCEGVLAANFHPPLLAEQRNERSQ